MTRQRRVGNFQTWCEAKSDSGDSADGSGSDGGDSGGGSDSDGGDSSDRGRDSWYHASCFIIHVHDWLSARKFEVRAQIRH